jgi:riboflavin synthase
MFTGLIEDTGSVAAITTGSAGQRVLVDTGLDLADTKLGDSIAVDGVCLTAVKLERVGNRWRVSFDVGPETLKVTAFRDTLRVGRQVHLERAVRVGDRLGGHIVSGHVDAVGQLRARRPIGDALFLLFAAPPAVHELCIDKGSIAIDGVSLTINGVDDDGFDVCLIPHTLGATHLVDLKPGDAVNLENDVVGKYVRRLLAPHGRRGGVDEALLQRSGFLSR